MKKIVFPLIFSIFTYLILFIFIVFKVSDVLNFSFLLQYKEQIINGAYLTFLISIVSLFTSTILGFIFFLLSESKNNYLKLLVVFYKEIIMGTPLLVLVFVIVYIVGPVFKMNDKMFLGFISLTLYISPYMANVYEGAYKTLGKNQFVIIDFYGFNLFQKYRYIILPQLIKPIIPGLINNLSGIIKGTSILSTIAIAEIFYSVSLVSNRSYRYIEGYFILWIVYLIITIPLSLLAKYLGRKWNK